MANLLVLVLDDLEKLADILEAWESAGVPGVTLLDSVGTRTLKEQVASRDDLPLMPSLRSLFEKEETHNRTLFAVIEGDAILERAVDAAQKIVGDFSEPHTGILFVVPVSRTWGIPKPRRGKKKPAAND